MPAEIPPSGPLVSTYPDEGRPDLLMVELSWDDRGAPRDAAFGPWEVQEDDSHLAAIREFMADWQRETGITPQRAVMALIFEPGKWLRDRKERLAMEAAPPAAATSDGSYCARCDVFTGTAGAGVSRPPPDHEGDWEWLSSHCWVCGRSADEIAAASR